MDIKKGFSDVVKKNKVQGGKAKQKFLQNESDPRRNEKNSFSVPWCQGDQIGRIFAYLGIF
jgi:hypothetical protein